MCLKAVVYIYLSENGVPLATLSPRIARVIIDGKQVDSVVGGKGGDGVVGVTGCCI